MKNMLATRAKMLGGEYYAPRREVKRKGTRAGWKVALYRGTSYSLVAGRFATEAYAQDVAGTNNQYIVNEFGRKEPTRIAESNIADRLKARGSESSRRTAAQTRAHNAETSAREFTRCAGCLEQHGAGLPIMGNWNRTYWHWECWRDRDELEMIP